jgi:hypothetical protein
MKNRIMIMLLSAFEQVGGSLALTIVRLIDELKTLQNMQHLDVKILHVGVGRESIMLLTEGEVFSLRFHENLWHCLTYSRLNKQGKWDYVYEEEVC